MAPILCLYLIRVIQTIAYCTTTCPLINPHWRERSWSLILWLIMDKASLVCGLPGLAEISKAQLMLSGGWLSWSRLFLPPSVPQWVYALLLRQSTGLVRGAMFDHPRSPQSQWQGRRMKGRSHMRRICAMRPVKTGTLSTSSRAETLGTKWTHVVTEYWHDALLLIKLSGFVVELQRVDEGV